MEPKTASLRPVSVREMIEEGLVLVEAVRLREPLRVSWAPAQMSQPSHGATNPAVPSPK